MIVLFILNPNYYLLTGQWMSDAILKFNIIIIYKLIMYTIQENLAPIVDKYNDFLNGFYLSGLLRFKGQQEVGGDYISKVFKA